MKASDSHEWYRDSLDKGEGRPRLNQTEQVNRWRSFQTKNAAR